MASGALTADSVSGNRGIRHLNTFSGTQQDHKAGPFPSGFVESDTTTSRNSKFRDAVVSDPTKPDGRPKKVVAENRVS